MQVVGGIAGAAVVVLAALLQGDSCPAGAAVVVVGALAVPGGGGRTSLFLPCLAHSPCLALLVLVVEVVAIVA